MGDPIIAWPAYYPVARVLQATTNLASLVQVAILSWAATATQLALQDTIQIVPLVSAAITLCA